jgi:hypothetical protein
MQLNHGAHLAYCTNIHPGEDWAQTFDSLKRYTLAVRNRVSPGRPFAIGLRLSDHASRELVKPTMLAQFAQWLRHNDCYVFTINGFPFGRFHGVAIKEQVYAPDWTTPERLAYTNRLFDILAALLPDGVDGSVSTVPGSFKEFIRTREQVEQIHENLWRCIEHVAAISAQSGKTLYLGLEPEPLGLLENTAETLGFFDAMEQRRPGDDRLHRHLGINYDTCHFALQFEEPRASLDAFARHKIKLTKIHLSSALRLAPDEQNLMALRRFLDDTYLHQVVTRDASGRLMRYKDLPFALQEPACAEEWRVHFHVPLYTPPAVGLNTTTDHLLGVLDWLSLNTDACSHLEMETYTWAVLPDQFKSASVADQLAREYEWILPQLSQRGLA